MERGRRLFTHLVLRSARRALLLLLCCSSIVSFAQTVTPIISAPLRQQKAWIVGHSGDTEVNATQSVVPGCTDLCLNALSPIYGETLVGLSVQLYPCQDSDNSLFQYDDTSKAITMWDPASNVNLCLDAASQLNPSTAGYSRFTLQECDANATNQQWTFQADGQIRSGLANSTATSYGQPLFMRGSKRRPADWGTGSNTFGLYLSSTGRSSPDTGISSFNLLPYASPSSSSAVWESSLVAQPSNGNVDMIKNGGFESCGYDAGNGSVADFSSSTWWFILCNWTISSGSVQIVNGGNNASTLHLNGNNGPGAVTQLIAAEAGSNYSLSFDLAGSGTRSCGSRAKTLNVSISPSSLPLTSLAFDVSGKTTAAVGWKSPPPLNFTAYGTSINFTFESTTDGICGPLIDNVEVRKLQSSADKSAGDDGLLVKVLTVTVSVVAVAVLIPTLFCCYWIWRRHRGDPETQFVKGIRWQSEVDVLEAGFKSGSRCESFSGGKYGIQYSWAELEKATQNFGKVLGNGGSGLLFLAEFTDGLLAAVKVDGTHQRQWTSDEAFKQEVAILYRLHHAYLVSFLGVCVGQGTGIKLAFDIVLSVSHLIGF